MINRISLLYVIVLLVNLHDLIIFLKQRHRVKFRPSWRWRRTSRLTSSTSPKKRSVVGRCRICFALVFPCVYVFLWLHCIRIKLDRYPNTAFHNFFLPTNVGIFFLLLIVFYQVAKLARAEQAVEKYQKKLEEMLELKKQNKDLCDKMDQYLDQIHSLESANKVRHSV